MFSKILGIAAVSAVLATSALAQTSTTPDQGTAANNAEAEKAMMEKWKGPIGMAFFTDDTMGTMKSEADMKTGWASLTPEQQAQMKTDCVGQATSQTQTAPDASTTSGDGANQSNFDAICKMINAM